MSWKDTPENRRTFVADVEAMVARAGGTDALVHAAVKSWQHVNDNMHVDPASLEREALEQAYTNAMHAAWHLARLSYAVNGALLDGGDARRYNATKNADGRWARLDPVKDWAFQQRRGHPQGSRAEVIRRILPDVRQRASAAGESLTGSDAAVTRTVTDWFKKAGIR